ncbi:hypothetical protein [Agromyces ramosus]|uniref:Uncharacterized protein n=1 Tax=Agromyces ramosus TaxID=33879 RepID=A0ABU0R5P1_9MICO|nr:hypothetical protein [Agromyces ramosus]MDQ0893384.1 hypothetical protein [Agromyces ramosus]
MTTRRDTTLDNGGSAILRPHGPAARRQATRMLGLAAVALIVVALGVNQAQSAQAAAHLTQAKELAVAEVGNRVGVGAAGLDIAALRSGAASSLAASAVAEAQSVIDEAGAALGADGVSNLTALRGDVLTMIRFGDDAAALVAGADALRAEQLATSTALAAHRAAEAARLAAEAEAARIAAAEAAAAAAEASDVAADEAEWSSDADAGTAAAAPADSGAAAGTVNPYTAEFYPGLPPAPRDEDCGPCLGKPMYPVLYNGKYTWGCSA